MKICVIYATAGAGHRMAAEALYAGLRERAGVQAVCVDALDFTGSFFRKQYSSGYTFIVTRMPWMWWACFSFLNYSPMFSAMQATRRLQNTLFARQLCRYFEQEQFDCIITTHFLANEVAAYLKRRGRIRSKLVTVVTDYDVHRIWLSQGVDVYAAACDVTVEKLKQLGVPEDRVALTGIPTHRKFSRPKDLEALRHKLDLDSGAFTVLVATGSFGTGPMEELIDRLKGFQVMIVCGYNRRLYEKLRSRQKGLVKIFGLVDNMEELMAVSQAMITKPGGLSISEALVSGLPMIFFSAIPGQESNNIRVLKRYGIGVSDCPVAGMADVLNRYRDCPQEYEALRKNVLSLARPDAVEKILEAALAR